MYFLTIYAISLTWLHDMTIYYILAVFFKLSTKENTEILTKSHFSDYFIQFPRLFPPNSPKTSTVFKVIRFLFSCKCCSQ